MAKNNWLSLEKLLDAAPPADVKQLMLRTPSGTQRTHALELIARWKEIRGWRDDWTIPTRRCLVIFAREKIKMFDDVTDRERRRFLESAGIEHSPQSILTYDSYLDHDMVNVAAQARVLITELNRSLSKHVKTEIENATAFLRPLYEAHNCVHAIPDAEPVRMLSAALERIEHAATGQVFIGPWEAERFLNEWLA